MGNLIIWDTTVVRHTKYQEHTERVWSVAYNQYDSALLATGGDDCSLRLWDLTSSHSIQCRPTPANVCTVKFQPGNSNYLAYGGADFMIRLFDIRLFTEPVISLKGHKKAVSYIHYLNDNHLVSASTDSELKLWSIDTGICVKVYSGHVNNKNFIGLTGNEDYITCGSEDNSLYVYNKNSSKPLLKYKFCDSENNLPTASQVIDNGSDCFVSAVCSRKGHNSNGIVAANSQGFIKVLEMI
jgi:E3 ubiquitin-protein ligase RFWD2